MKVLLLGSDGLLGSELKKVFSSDYDITAFVRENLDITDEKEVLQKVEEIKPRIIINATGYTSVDNAESEKDLATAVNGYAVGYLAKAAQKVGALLVHYSTDYVFSGNKGVGYTEDDMPAEVPSTIYGQSKLLGEMELQKNTDKFYLIRTSWVFGSGGKNFVDTMIRLGTERDELRVVNDQHGKPTYAVDLAKATRDLIESSAKFGIYHLTNEGDTTWYEYAKYIIGKYGTMQKWRKKELRCIILENSEDFSRLHIVRGQATPAKRPSWSILVNTKFPHLRPWQEALKEYLNSLI